MCEPGSARFGSCGASSMRLIPSATSAMPVTSASCQTSIFVAAIALAPTFQFERGSRLGADGLVGFGGEHAVKNAANPHPAGIDVQVVELVVRVGINGFLLGLEHRLVFAEDPMHPITQLGGDQLAVQAVVAHERPEV